MRRAAIAIIAVLALSASGCSQPGTVGHLSEKVADRMACAFSEVADSELAAVQENAEEVVAEETAVEEPEQQEDGYDAYYAEYYEPTYYAQTYSGVQGDPDGLNSFVGVVDGPNGTTETAYSSNVLYHYRTSEWQPDEYGFYRTSDGYYVVASNDYEEGTIIETSRGEAMVLDGGCDSGIVDFYTNW